MQSHFNAEFFINNRKKLQDILQTQAPIVITGNGVMQKGGDESFRFHQDSNFWYLTGLNVSDLILVIAGSETFLIAPTLTFEREAFDGAHDYKALTARSGITQIYDGKTGWKKISEIVKTSHTVATLLSPPSYMKRHSLYTLPYRRQLITKLKRLDPTLTIQDVRAELAGLRCIKQQPELKALQQAIDTTVQTLADVRQPDFLSTTDWEYELEAAIQYGFRKRGSEGEAFFSIVGAGKHSTTLHHQENDGPIVSDDLIVLDIGASVEHYAADITRTVSKAPLSKRKQDIFDAVQDVQDYALSIIKPGILPREYEKLVEIYMGTKLQSLNIIKEPNHDVIRHYFPHATSHFLGLDTHDVGDYQTPYEAGMVITCEPGIYVPEEGIGVRIEDDVLITSNGNKVLSAACPRKAF